MKLAPRMIQSMEILQLSTMDLQDRIDQELTENPLLEQIASAPKDDFVREESPQNNPDYEPDKVMELDRREMVTEDNNSSDFERLLEMSKEWPDDNYTSGSKPSGNQMDSDGDRAHDLMANAASRPQTLHDYLVDQFHYFDVEPIVRDFGEYLIQNLDSNGRLQSSLPELIQVFGRSITHEQAEKTLKLIQKLDPPGIGARDLKECLLLQITPKTPMRDVLRRLISEHLDDVAENRLPLIERKTGYSLDTIKTAIEEMRTLNPLPGRSFLSEPVHTVSPDLRVEKNEDGKWTVTLIEEYVPQLRISRKFVRMLENNPDQQTKDFVKKKLESARWLIDSIEQRYNTLKKVAQSIVDRQIDFLELGPEHIKPLKMDQIAEVVKVHVTTVSRAVDDKYLLTPRGVFPLRRFFGGGSNTTDGEEVAWETIRIKLKEIVEKEDKLNPLSDDDLVVKLSETGYNVKRRTVTKYRKALNIPSSRQRREWT